MAELSVNFVNQQAGGRMITVNLDDSTTVQEAIAELLAAQFIVANPQGYQLARKPRSGEQINEAVTLPNDGVFRDYIQNNDTISVIPATDAGYDKEFFYDPF